MKKFISILFTFICLVTATAVSASAANGNCEDFGNFYYTSDNVSSPVVSYLSKCSNGNYMRVQFSDHNPQHERYEKILIEYYDKKFNFISYKTIKPVLPTFGAFYETEDNYYIITGQRNLKEKANVECFNVAKYDKNWKLIKDIGLKDCNTIIPFKSGSVRVAVNRNYMVIHTCHEMYKSSDGKNHQSNYTLYFDMDSMKELRSAEPVYVSHSFNQFIQVDGEKFITVDHGDGFPRYISLSEFTKTTLIENDTDYDYVNKLKENSYNDKMNNYCECCDEDCEICSKYGGEYDYDYDDCEELPSEINMFSFGGGDIGDNYTGCTIGGFEVTNTSYIVVGNSVDNNNYETSNTRNIFVSVIHKDEIETEVKETISTQPDGSIIYSYEYPENKGKVTRLTSHKEGTDSVSNPHLVKVNDNRLFVIWSRKDKVYYKELNGKGETVGKTKSFKANLTDCKPIVSDNKIVWYSHYFDYVSSTPKIDFYTIDLNDTSKTSVTTLKNGEHNYKVTKVIEKATFTKTGKQKVTCKSCGKTKTETIPKKTVSKVKNLKATSAAKTKVTLKWSKASNAKKYRIYISKDGKKWKKIATTSKTSYKVKELSSGKVYRFKVKAVNGDYSGKESSVLKIKTKLSTPKITVKAVKKKAILNIGGVRGATYYQIVYSTDKDLKEKVTKVYIDDSDSIKKVIKKLKKGKKYYFKVRACCKYDGKKIYSDYTKVQSVKIKSKPLVN